MTERRHLPLAGRSPAPASSRLRLAGRAIAITGVSARPLAVALAEALGELGCRARIVEPDGEAAVLALAELGPESLTIGVGPSFYALCEADWRIAIGEVSSIAERAVARSADLWLAEPRVEVIRSLARGIAAGAAS